MVRGCSGMPSIGRPRSSGCLRTTNEQGITPTQNMTTASTTQAARQSQVEMTHWTVGAITIIPKEPPKCTSPTALPR